MAEASKLLSEGAVVSYVFVAFSAWFMLKGYPAWMADKREFRAYDAEQRKADRAQRDAEIDRMLTAFAEERAQERTAHVEKTQLIVEAFARSISAFKEATSAFLAAGAGCPVRDNPSLLRREEGTSK